MSLPSNVVDLITLHEGRRNRPYRDSRGFWTVGVGHLITKAPELPPAWNRTLSDVETDTLLQSDVEAHTADLHKALPWVAPWVSSQPARHAVLVDMAFNLGLEPFDGDGFKDWPRFVAQLKRGDYATAALNMRATQPWASQVKGRALRLAHMMETNQWPAA